MTGCIDTPTAEPPANTNNDDRLGRIEKQILDLVKKVDSVLELAIAKSPTSARKQWLAQEMDKRGYLSWGLCADDMQFRAHFRSPRDFHYIAGEMALMKDWKSVRINSDRYYFTNGFDIETFKTKAKWRNYTPKDTKFHEYLVREVILRRETINLLDFLRNEYPNKADSWHNDVIDFVTGYIRKGGYKIDRAGDIFTKREATT
jgi:hypothetical protein